MKTTTPLPYLRQAFLGLFASSMLGSAAMAEMPLRVVGQSSNATKHVELETAFFNGLQDETGISSSVSFNASDVVGVRPPDALRLIRAGTFDIISTQIGQAARDDAFFEGIDLIGVATDVPALRRSVDAFRKLFDERLQERFNAKVLTLWPFGPQVIFCNGALSGVEDLRNRRVRVFTASMAALVDHVGGNAVTLPAAEVYPALQRGVVDCAITSATSANTSRWPELTTHYFPLGLAGSVQGHFINLDTWRRFTPEQQTAMTAAFERLEGQMWDLAISSNEDAANCNIGSDACLNHTRYDMTLVPVSPADVETVQRAAVEVVLPLFRAGCEQVEANCVALWNNSVGQAHGLSIP